MISKLYCSSNLCIRCGTASGRLSIGGQEPSDEPIPLRCKLFGHKYNWTVWRWKSES